MARTKAAPLGFAVAALLSVSAAVAGDADVVLRVGAKSASVADVTRRLAALPDFQRAALGASDDEVKRKFINDALVPELLFASEAEQRKLDQQPALQDRIRDGLRQAMERELRSETLAKKPVTPEAIKAYFDKHRDKFEVPRRIRIWRVLVKDEATAKKLISEAAGAGGPQRWSTFAREQSLDKATHQREGDLGFVREDGSTDTPQLRVNPALFAAADKLADGAIAPEPVAEGPNFAVVWRRGSMPAVKRSVEQEQESIRQVLEREYLDEARKALLNELRKTATKQNVDLVDQVPSSAFGDFKERQQHTFVPPHRTLAGSKIPKAVEGAVR
jgi:peptidyl-prolyl cis-trans isomerase C